ncbi:MAG: hypothetical protein KatS3mg051_2141 [Anaerolineae bacterium]|nr:MAG: hypothetical protein KatS3mg051_2141 [Anaerolineae bacterium]
MDWLRYLRAMDAAEIERVERLRALQIAGKIKAADIAPEDWELIRQHDRLLADEG